MGPVRPGPVRVAVLASGGLDSAVLVAEMLEQAETVQPIYVRFGLAWEETERTYLQRFLGTLPRPGLRPLVVLDQPVADLYGRHWSVTGDGVPAAGSPDEAVHLPGRNWLLLAKPLAWCATRGFDSLALGILRGNPFADARPAFLSAVARAADLGLGGDVAVIAPFRKLRKQEVLRRGQGLALEWTLSCNAPVGGLACGLCNKCEERRRGFAALGWDDRTRYAPSRDFGEDRCTESHGR